MAKDRYGSFEELSSAEIAGEDFSIVSKDRGTKALILAPHGGFIEPGTSQISRTVAATKYSLYIFEGLKNRKHSELHITSTSFDEPRAMELAEKSETIVRDRLVADTAAMASFSRALHQALQGL